MYKIAVLDAIYNLHTYNIQQHGYRGDDSRLASLSQIIGSSLWVLAINNVSCGEKCEVSLHFITSHSLKGGGGGVGGGSMGYLGRFLTP